MSGGARIEVENSCLILTVVEGAIAVDGDLMTPLLRGQTLLVPAAWGCVQLESVGDSPAKFLLARLP